MWIWGIFRCGFFLFLRQGCGFFVSRISLVGFFGVHIPHSFLWDLKCPSCLTLFATRLPLTSVSKALLTAPSVFGAFQSASTTCSFLVCFLAGFSVSITSLGVTKAFPWCFQVALIYFGVFFFKHPACGFVCVVDFLMYLSCFWASNMFGMYWQASTSCSFLCQGFWCEIRTCFVCGFWFLRHCCDNYFAGVQHFWGVALLHAYMAWFSAFV